MSDQTSMLAGHLHRSLPDSLDFLAELAYNFWWSWSEYKSSVFREIEPEKWEQSSRNPVQFLKEVKSDRARAAQIKLRQN